MNARLLVAAGLAIAAMIAAPAPARADDPIGVGLYAPSAPFGGTADRLGFVTSFAEHLSTQLGTPVNGRVYSSAGALDAALKKGEIHFAILDAPTLVTRGGRPLLTLTRGGGTGVAWAVVGSAGKGLDGLAGKRVAVAQTGGREAAFVAGVLFEGEIEAGHFAAVVEAPDVLSAIKMVPLGRADVAVVPADLDRGGLGLVLGLRSLPWPSLVAGAKADGKLTERVVAAARGWKGAGPFGGWSAGVATPGAGHARRRPVMATPPPRRLEVAPVLGRRSYVSPRADIRRYVSAK